MARRGRPNASQIELKFGGVNKARWLEVFVSREPASGNMSLVLTDKNGHTQNLAPLFNPGMEWKSKLIKLPPGSFTLRAQDDSETAWLAFSNPREVGWLSATTERISAFILEVLAPLLAACLMALLVLRDALGKLPSKAGAFLALKYSLAGKLHAATADSPTSARNFPPPGRSLPYRSAESPG